MLDFNKKILKSIIKSLEGQKLSINLLVDEFDNRGLKNLRNITIKKPIFIGTKYEKKTIRVQKCKM